jgi:hypothetical protein
MTEPTTPANIYTALAAVMRDVSHVAKLDVNQHQRFNFRGIDAVMNAAGPAFRAHGVICTPHVEHATYETVQTSGGKPSTACRVLVTYTFHAPDGSSLAARVTGEAWDAGDKATPKAMSVAYRTALLQALCLPTDEPDPDIHTYERAPEPSPAERALAGVRQATTVETVDRIMTWAADSGAVTPELHAAADARRGQLAGGVS